MRKRIVAILVAAIVLTAIAQPAWAHGREQHDADIELILFGCENYKESHSSAKDSIQALEDAVYLAVDQFNGNGAKELEQLKGMGIKGLPRSIDAFDYSSNSTHRGLTHRGWDFEYLEKAHWPIRKSILTNTVQKVLFDESAPLSWFPWLSDKLYDTTQSTKQRDSFCALLCCPHQRISSTVQRVSDSFMSARALTWFLCWMAEVRSKACGREQRASLASSAWRLRYRNIWNS